MRENPKYKCKPDKETGCPIVITPDGRELHAMELVLLELNKMLNKVRTIEKNWAEFLKNDNKASTKNDEDSSMDFCPCSDHD